MPALNRQHTQEYVYDFAVAGGAISAIALGTLPKYAIVTGFAAVVETAVTSAGAATIALGTTTNAGQFLAATAKGSFDTIGKVVGGAPAAFAQALVANDEALILTIATAALTAGKVRLKLDIYMPSSGVVSGS